MGLIGNATLGTAGGRCAVAYLEVASVCRRRFPAAHHRLRLVLGAGPCSAKQAGAATTASASNHPVPESRSVLLWTD